MTTLPLSPSALTPAWLDAALHESGVLTSSHVTDARAEAIGEGAGVLGQLARVALSYDRPQEGAPQTLIAKMAAAAAENRELANGFGFYEREVSFYESLAERCPLRVPRCYFAGRGEGVGEIILLLEDLSGMTAGDQVAGASLDQARRAMKSCARLNASWWGSPQLDELDWIPPLDDEVQIAALDGPVRAAWDGFLDVWRDKLSEQTLEAARGLRDDVPGIMRRLQQSPAANTLVHGDFRLDNMFFGGPSEPFALIDWQILFRTTPGVDLGWFLAESVDPELRRAHEWDLLDLYLAELGRQGVHEYDREQLIADYQLGILFRFVAPILLFSGGFDVANERGNQLAEALVTRNAAAIDDHELGRLL